MKNIGERTTNFRISDTDNIVHRKTVISEDAEKLLFPAPEALESKDIIAIQSINDFARFETITLKEKLYEVSGTKACVTWFGLLIGPMN